MSTGSAMSADDKPSETHEQAAHAPGTVSAQRTSGREILRVYALFLVATIVLTWPVALRIGRDLPGGPGDPEMLTWNIWWLKFSLFHLHQNPLWCSEVAWPFGCSFAFHTHTILYGIIAILLSPLGINMAAAISLLFLNSFALTGLGAYLWCREFGASRRGAFVGGFVVTFSIYRFGRGMCHYNLLATEFLPFFWLALKRAFEIGRLRSFLWAAALLLLNFWQDVQLFLFAGLFGIFYLGWAILGRPRRLLELSLWKGVGAAAVAFLLGSLPYWIAVVPLLSQGEYAVRDNSPPTIADVLSFFVPWPYHWLLGKWTKSIYRSFPFPDIETAYIGYIVLALGAIGFWIARTQKRRIGWLAVTGLVFLMLSFGENVQVGGQTAFEFSGTRYSIQLPGALLKWIPGLRQFRVFSRFIFLTVFALAVPVALAMDWLEQRARSPRTRKLVLPVLLALIILEVASLPYLTHPRLLPAYAPFSLLEIIRNDPERTTVFTVPPTIFQPQEQYFQMFHEKPIYGGSLARRPDFLFHRYYRLPGVGNLFWERQPMFKEKDADEGLTPEFVDRFIEMHNIKYLILAPGPNHRVVRQLVESRFPSSRQWYERNFVLYELERPPAGRPLSIDLGERWGALYVGRGFFLPCPLGSWAVQPEAELKLPIRGKAWKTLTIEMTPFTYTGSESQTVELFLNDRGLGGATLQPCFASYSFAIPDGALDDRPCSTLRFHFRYCVSPSELGLSEDRRTLAAAVRQLHILATPPQDLPTTASQAALP